jgi:phosphate-selective porin OprO/OprP
MKSIAVTTLLLCLTSHLWAQVDPPIVLEERVQQLEARLKALETPVPAAVTLAATAEPKKFPTYQINGGLQADAGWYSQSPANMEQVGDLQDGAAFRRARLGINGLVRENISYFLQMDFAFPGRPTFTDVYLDIAEVPGVGHLRFGQWKQPFSIEIVSSYKQNPWLERSPVFLLSPFRRIGIGVYDHSENESFTYALSVMKPGNDQYGGDLGDDGGVGVAGRLTANPWFENDSERVLHLGAAFYSANPGNNLFRVGAFGGNAPEFALNINNTIQPSMVDTGFIPTEWYHAIQSEVAWVYGALSIQAEGVYSLLEHLNGETVNFTAGYVGISYFLTGEHRQYDPKRAAFGPIKVCNEYNPCSNGLAFGGAWELTARLSYINTNDGNINGGELTDVTAGVNWWLNSNTRLTFNYIHTWLDKQPTGQSEADIFAVRAQIDW